MKDDSAIDISALRIREAVRGLIIDPDRRVLLVRWQFPNRTVWGTPGGGMEPDEGTEEALRRELEEELGLVDALIGPHIWERRHIIPFIDGMWDGQHDRFFLIESHRFEPAPTLTWEQLNAEHLMEMRWWTQAELATFAPTDHEYFAPRRLPELVSALLIDGPPEAPFDVGV